MRYFLLLTILVLSANADLKDTLYGMYGKKEYQHICTIGLNGINQYKDDEDYLSIYAFSCLYSDNIDQLAFPITLLYRTKESRKNAAYLSTILMQKKLLLTALVDNQTLNSFDMPSTDYILSKVFDLYLNQNSDNSGHLVDKKDSRISYTLNITKTDSKNIIVIEEYYDKILTNRHLYH